MRLLIGNKNYSSWSFRTWFLLRQADIPFEEEAISFNDPKFHERVRRYSPAGRVPVLIDGDVVIWDSMAIAEYVAERFPEKKLWPEDSAVRAHARAITAEMHSGFADLRRELPMNCEARFTTSLLRKSARRDILRITQMWEQCRDRFGNAGPFLFGHFTIVDAFYAPVVVRFSTHAIELPEQARLYAESLIELPAFKEWVEAACRESDYVEMDEPFRERR